MNDPYVPELGQAVFGQPWQEYPCPDWLVALLSGIDTELYRVMDGRLPIEEDYASPFSNSGNSFENETFAVFAYSWDEETPQPYNFKWGSLEISWYKHLSRGTTMNREIAPAMGVEMYESCLASLHAMEENNEDH